MTSLVQPVDGAAIVVPVVVVLGAIGALLADLVVPKSRWGAPTWLGLASLLIAAGVVVTQHGERRSTFCVDAGGPAPSCSFVLDPLTWLFWVLIVGASIGTLLLAIEPVRRLGLPEGEYVFLLLSSVAGALALVAARDLVTAVIALEVLSLPVFALVALPGGRRPNTRGATEAALKLFLVSVSSTALMLYGVSVLYGLTGTVFYDRLGAADVPAGAAPALAVGVVLALAGFAFKVAAVPLHAWAPDTYEGAPLPVAAYLSVVSKAAGFGALLVLLHDGLSQWATTWSPVLAVVAALTMTVGNLLALRQHRAIRLLAWSSVAQAGYMLVPLGALGASGATADRQDQAFTATAAYAAVYTAMNLAAFAVVVRVGRRSGGGLLADYRGLAWRSPLQAAVLGFALASLAGLPPGLAGLFVKVTVVRAALGGDVRWLAVLVAVNVVIGLGYYLPWGASLLARAPAQQPASDSAVTPDGLHRLGPRGPAWPAMLTAGLATLAVVVISLLPQVALGAGGAFPGP